VLAAVLHLGNLKFKKSAKTEDILFEEENRMLRVLFGVSVVLGVVCT
jgi:hypothetical protein